RRLAESLRTEPELRGVGGLRIRPAFAGRPLARRLGWFVGHYGFESISDRGPTIRGSRALRWLDSLWLWLLTWTYNPRSLRGRGFARTRQEFWISRAKFIARYGQPHEAGPQDRQSSGVR